MAYLMWRRATPEDPEAIAQQFSTADTDWSREPAEVWDPLLQMWRVITEDELTVWRANPEDPRLAGLDMRASWMLSTMAVPGPLGVAFEVELFIVPTAEPTLIPRANDRNRLRSLMSTRGYSLVYDDTQVPIFDVR